MRGDDDDPGQSTVARSRERLIAQAQERTYKSAQRYIQAANSVDDSGMQQAGAAELHNAVIGYYRALAPLSDHSAVSGFWDSVELWESPDGETVTGFDALADWAVRYRTTTDSAVGFTGRERQQQREPARLPPQVSLQIAQQLHRAAVKLGFKPPMADTTDDPYQLGRQPTEDHDEPIDESVQKPEQ
jgi:hypothetical protein